MSIIIDDFDKQFHSDHPKLNKILKGAGISFRYNVPKKRRGK